MYKEYTQLSSQFNRKQAFKRKIGDTLTTI
jgi:hypothetical protein